MKIFRKKALSVFLSLVMALSFTTLLGGMTAFAALAEDTPGFTATFSDHEGNSVVANSVTVVNTSVTPNLVVTRNNAAFVVDNSAVLTSRTIMAKNGTTPLYLRASGTTGSFQDTITLDLSSKKTVEVSTSKIASSTYYAYVLTASRASGTITVQIEVLCPNAKAQGFGTATLVSRRSVTIPEGSTVWKALEAVTGPTVISLLPILDYTGPLMTTRIPNYVYGINGLNAGIYNSGSGWMYGVNGTAPSYGATQYILNGGELISWQYTVNIGDVSWPTN